MTRNVILFVSPPAPFLDEPAYVPHLGLLYLSSALKQATSLHEWSQKQAPIPHYLELGHVGEDDEAYGVLRTVVHNLSPCCVAFTATTPQYDSVVYLSTQLRKDYPEIHTLIGGQQRGLNRGVRPQHSTM
jgi:hypothetical protein